MVLVNIRSLSETKKKGSRNDKRRNLEETNLRFFVSTLYVQFWWFGESQIERGLRFGTSRISFHRGFSGDFRSFNMFCLCDLLIISSFCPFKHLIPPFLYLTNDLNRARSKQYAAKINFGNFFHYNDIKLKAEWGWWLFWIHGLNQNDPSRLAKNFHFIH